MMTTHARILSCWADIISAKTEVWLVPKLGNIKQHSNYDDPVNLIYDFHIYVCPLLLLLFKFIIIDTY